MKNTTTKTNTTNTTPAFEQVFAQALAQALAPMYQELGALKEELANIKNNNASTKKNAKKSEAKVEVEAKVEAKSEPKAKAKAKTSAKEETCKYIIKSCVNIKENAVGKEMTSSFNALRFALAKYEISQMSKATKGKFIDDCHRFQKTIQQAKITYICVNNNTHKVYCVNKTGDAIILKNFANDKMASIDVEAIERWTKFYKVAIVDSKKVKWDIK